MRIYIHIHIYVYLHTYKIHRHIYISPNISAEFDVSKAKSQNQKPHNWHEFFFLPSKRGDINLTLFLESNLRKLYAVIHDIHGDQFQDSAVDI